MYTVFTADGAPKRNRLGLVIFTRTLRAARLYCQPGDTVTGWTNSGGIRGRWQCGDDWKVRKS